METIAYKSLLQFPRALAVYNLPTYTLLQLRFGFRGKIISKKQEFVVNNNLKLWDATKCRIFQKSQFARPYPDNAKPQSIYCLIKQRKLKIKNSFLNISDTF